MSKKKKSLSEVQCDPNLFTRRYKGVIKSYFASAIQDHFIGWEYVGRTATPDKTTNGYTTYPCRMFDMFGCFKIPLPNGKDMELVRPVECCVYDTYPGYRSYVVEQDAKIQRFLTSIGASNYSGFDGRPFGLDNQWGRHDACFLYPGDGSIPQRIKFTMIAIQRWWKISAEQYFSRVLEYHI